MLVSLPRLRSLARLPLVAAALACAVAGPAFGAPDDPLHIIVLHTNDVHGQVQPRPALWLSQEAPPPVGGLRRLASTVRRVRAEGERTGAGVLVVDAGDWFQGTPEGLVDHGRAFVRAMLAVGYDALCVGNHEFDHGLPHLLGLLADFRVPALCANLFEPDGERVEWVAPWKVVEVVGIRVGLVGLLTPGTPHITHADAGRLRFADPVAELRRARVELADDVDWILPLTHLGLDGDIELALAFPDLPLIVGGTGLYIKALTEGLAAIPEIPDAVNEEVRALYDSLGGEAFKEALAKLDGDAARRLPAGDSQRLTRAMAVVRATGKPLAQWQGEQGQGPAVAARFLTIALVPGREDLYAACEARFKAMLEGGVIDEVHALLALGLDASLPAMKALGVPELGRHVNGEISLDEAADAAKQATRNFAKRQLTWLRNQVNADHVIEDFYGPANRSQVVDALKVFIKDV